jgi:photosystem II stability/assembly factor-like uncharacterized protein
MSRVPLRTTAALAGVLLLAGCGASATPITFDPPTSASASTTTVDPIGSVTLPPADGAAGSSTATSGQWADVTGNLVGLQSECGLITNVTARPDRDAVIAGIAKQGLWSTGEGTDTWTQLGQGGGAAIVNRPTSLVFAPEKPATFWESGIYNSGGVYRTDDDGATFQPMGNIEHSDSVSVDLADPAHQTLLSGTHESSKVLRSTNGGQTWQDISAGLPADVGYTSFPLVLDAQTYLLGTRNSPTGGVLRSTDGGTTWTMVHPGPVSGPALVAKSDGKIYWLLDKGNMIASGDGGATWTEIPSTGPAGGQYGGLLELPDGRLATLGVTNVLISEDHGAHWHTVGPGLPFQPAGLTYSPVRQTFYVWQSTCDASAASSPVAAGSIMRLDDFALS